MTFPCTMYTADAGAVSVPVPFVTKLHWHDAVEILYFRKGTFQLSVDTRQYTICGETFCFIESERLHSIRSEADYLEHALLFDPSFLSASHPDEADSSLLDPLLHRQLTFPLLLSCDSPAFEEIRSEYQKLLQIFNTFGVANEDQVTLSAPASQLRVRAGLLNILAALYEQDLLQVSSGKADPRIHALKEVMLYIQEHFDAKIYIRDLAQIMNMNEQYFCRYFHKATGKTAVSYINEIRIRRAMLILSRSPDKYVSITEAASLCGFGNMGYFIESFRHLTGMSPSDYRKRILAQGNAE